MKSFFDPCIDQIVELVIGQILQVERRGSRVKVNSSLLIILRSGKLIM